MKRVGQYGTGFLSRLKRATGDVIAYRWYEDGKGRKRILGLASEIKTEAVAWRKVERLGLNDHRLHQELDYASLGFETVE